MIFGKSIKVKGCWVGWQSAGWRVAGESKAGERHSGAHRWQSATGRAGASMGQEEHAPLPQWVSLKSTQWEQICCNAESTPPLQQIMQWPSVSTQLAVLELTNSQLPTVDLAIVMISLLPLLSFVCTDSNTVRVAQKMNAVTRVRVAFQGA